MPVLDIHPHIVSPDTGRYPLAPLGGTQSTWSSERPTTYEMLLAEMDAAGVNKAAIVHSSTAYGYDNSYVADAVAAVPSRFTAVCSIDVLAGDAVKTFDHWLASGCTGMRLFMDRFPKVTMILDHLSRAPFEDGPPYQAAAPLLELAKYQQLYLKITPINVTPKSWGKATSQTFFGKIIDTFGASRIAWGSNFPNSVGTLSEILGAARKAFAFAKASDQDWIFGKTALTLYPTLAK